MTFCPMVSLTLIIVGDIGDLLIFSFPTLVVKIFNSLSKLSSELESSRFDITSLFFSK